MMYKICVFTTITVPEGKYCKKIGINGGIKCHQFSSSTGFPRCNAIRYMSTPMKMEKDGNVLKAKWCLDLVEVPR